MNFAAFLKTKMQMLFEVLSVVESWDYFFS